GVQRVRTLPALLGDCELVTSRHPRIEGLEAVLAWGRKPSARVAETFAAQHCLPVWRAEDGFLRSVGLGDRDPPLSLVLDDQGIYYDGPTLSRLETLIARARAEDERARADELRRLWCEGRLSKYNHSREVPPPLPG